MIWRRMIFFQTTGGDFSYLKTLTLLLLLLIEIYNINRDEIWKFLNINKKVEIESLYRTDNSNLLDYLGSKINEPEKWL